ncbi:TPA: hypothetical protein ACGIR2_000750, partial [Shigella sonnei]
KVRESFINRLVLFSVVYYSGVPGVDYALFKESIKNIHVFDHMLDDKKDDSVYSFINSLDVIYERAEIAFDDDIDFYLKNGYLSTESNIRGIIEEKNKQYKEHKALCDVNNVWDIFSDSFKDNESEFISKIKCVINDNLSHIPVAHFIGLIDILNRLKIDCDSYIEAYADAFVSQDDAYTAFRNLYVEIFGNEKLGLLIQKKLMDKKPEETNLENVLYKIIEGKFNHSDIAYLNSFSEDDYLKWILSRNQDALDLVRKGLLRFKSMQELTEEQQKITNKAIGALTKLASRSSLNKLRVSRLLNN